MNPSILRICLLFTPGVLVNELRKKAGSSVFSKNHYGQFVRKRVKGTNPKTSKQTAVRASMSDFSKHWKLLTEDQRIAWNSYASGQIFKNRLGLNITLTGENMYIKLNRILATFEATAISDPPGPSDVIPDLVDAPVVTIVSGTSIKIKAGVAQTGTAYTSVFASKGLSVGKYYNSNYRFIGNYQLLTSDTDITTEYTDVFGAVPATGSKIFIKLIAVNNVKGLEQQKQVIGQTV
jgi:hypothetical protein